MPSAKAVRRSCCSSTQEVDARIACDQRRPRTLDDRVGNRGFDPRTLRREPPARHPGRESLHEGVEASAVPGPVGDRSRQVRPVAVLGLDRVRPGSQWSRTPGRRRRDRSKETPGTDPSCTSSQSAAMPWPTAYTLRLRYRSRISRRLGVQVEGSASCRTRGYCPPLPGTDAQGHLEKASRGCRDDRRLSTFDRTRACTVTRCAPPEGPPARTDLDGHVTCLDVALELLHRRELRSSKDEGPPLPPRRAVAVEQARRCRRRSSTWTESCVGQEGDGDRRGTPILRQRHAGVCLLDARPEAHRLEHVGICASAVASDSADALRREEHADRVLPVRAGSHDSRRPAVRADVAARRWARVICCALVSVTLPPAAFGRSLSRFLSALEARM